MLEPMLPSSGLGFAGVSPWQKGLGRTEGKGWLLLPPSYCSLQTNRDVSAAQVCGLVWLRLREALGCGLLVEGLGWELETWTPFFALALVWCGLEQISPQP